jgi:hypothetical protein
VFDNDVVVWELDRRWGPEQAWQAALNERFPRRPRHIPDRPEPIAGEARIVWERDGEEWVPARAIRWDRDHVLVAVDDLRCDKIGFWLAPRDFRLRTGQASPADPGPAGSASHGPDRAPSEGE